MTKFLIDFFPLLAFFITYKTKDIYWATGVLMVAAAIQTIGNYLLTKKWEKMHLYVLGFALFFGGLTLFLHDDRFIKLKVTLFFWFVAIVFLFHQFVTKTLTLKQLMEAITKEQWPVPEAVWSRLNLLWGITAFIVGALNLWVAFVLSVDNNDLWVNFKVWGISVIQFVLMFYTIARLFRFMPESTETTKE
jgi:intracellular septation protein